MLHSLTELMDAGVRPPLSPGGAEWARMCEVRAWATNIAAVETVVVFETEAVCCSLGHSKVLSPGGAEWARMCEARAFESVYMFAGGIPCAAALGLDSDVLAPLHYTHSHMPTGITHTTHTQAYVEMASSAQESDPKADAFFRTAVGRLSAAAGSRPVCISRQLAARCLAGLPDTERRR